MMTLLMIQNYPKAKERVRFMWPHWEELCWEIVGVDTEDGRCEWPCEVYTKRIGKNSYIDGMILPQKLTGCFQWFLEDEQFSDFTHVCVIENDTLFLKQPSLSNVYAAGILAGHYSPPRLAKHYYHNPWWVSRDAAKRFVEKAGELLAQGKNEKGSPDFFFGLVFERLGVEVLNLSESFTQNEIVDDRQINLARKAISNGAWIIHGIKTEAVLRRVLE